MLKNSLLKNDRHITINHLYEVNKYFLRPIPKQLQNPVTPFTQAKFPTTQQLTKNPIPYLKISQTPYHPIPTQKAPQNPTSPLPNPTLPLCPRTLRRASRSDRARRLMGRYRPPRIGGFYKYSKARAGRRLRGHELNIGRHLASGAPPPFFNQLTPEARGCGVPAVSATQMRARRRAARVDAAPR